MIDYRNSSGSDSSSDSSSDSRIRNISLTYPHHIVTRKSDRSLFIMYRKIYNNSYFVYD